MSTDTSPYVESEFQAQSDKAREIAASDFDYSVVVAGAFVRGMRKIGYKSASFAINELIDNSYQAGASKVAIWAETARPQNRVERLCVIDDGHGMVPEMIRLAMIWGGTHRENSRTLFGRFGFGLPSACVSIGRLFTVYSKPAGGTWYMCGLDLDSVGDIYTEQKGRVVVAEPVEAQLPAWVVAAMRHRQNFGADDLEHGTVVVIDKIDELQPPTITGIGTQMKRTFGLTHRNFCRKRPITVQGDRVAPVDPLFLTPGAWMFDYDEQRAVELAPISITIPNRETGENGTIRVRFSVMPNTFTAIDPSKPKDGRARANPRNQVLVDNNGLIMLRAGRQIDVITTSRGQDAEMKGSDFNVNNDDRFWGVEVDFSPVLDEEFSVTTSKQHIKMSSRIWRALEEHNVFAIIRDARGQYDKERARLLQEKREKKEQKRTSEEAMERAARANREDKTDPTRKERSDEGFDEEAERRSEQSGIPKDQITPALEEETKQRPWFVDFEDLPSGSPFYRLALVGGQRKLWINRGHRFFTDVFAGPNSTDESQAQWELLLFILGECEATTADENVAFYLSERVEWSRRLQVALSEFLHIRPRPEPVIEGDAGRPPDEAGAA